MRGFFWLVICLVPWLLMPGVVPAESGIVLEAPPASLAKWYKPQNKRQVWLHTMFRLRREVQALQWYARQGEMPLARSWGKKLLKDYRSIARMVPEWRSELELEWAGRLEQALADGDNPAAMRALRRIEQSCKGCHDSYQPQVAALYRSADFSQIQVLTRAGRKLAFAEQMRRLSEQVNWIKISLADERFDAAGKAREQLSEQLHELDASCKGCHGKDPVPRERVLGQGKQRLLDELQQAITQKEKQRAGRTLGSLAVEVCARCHATHRTLADLVRQMRNNLAY